MRPVRALGLGLLLVLPWLGPAASGAATACAADAVGHGHAALVVDTGGSTTTYCVGLDADSVSGLHLIALASAQYGLTYRLGFGGQALCQLDGVGPSSGDCFGDYPDYWGYWHGDGAGGWSWAGTGAASASIAQGDIDGWSWGSGDSGTTHPAPPAQRFEDVCAASPTPTPSPTPSPKPTHPPTPSHTPAPSATPSRTPSPTPGSSATVTPSVAASPRADPSPTGAASPSAAASNDIVRAVATGGEVPTSGGPPAGALLALGAVAMLGAGSWLTLRRRHREDPA